MTTCYCICHDKPEASRRLFEDIYGTTCCEDAPRMLVADRWRCSCALAADDERHLVAQDDDGARTLVECRHCGESRWVVGEEG